MGEERREERAGCVRGGCHMDDDVAGSPVLLPHLEGTEQFCCLPFMEGDIGSGSEGSLSLRQKVHDLTCCWYRACP